MKMIQIARALAFVSFLALIAAAPTRIRAEQNQVWTGTLVDASCYMTDNSQVGNDHMDMKGCATACLQMGRPAGLLTPDKKFFILLVPSPDIASYAGKTIRVTGKLRNGSILVDKFEAKKGEGWENVKFSTMM
jgi:hypothetical protein